MVWVKITLIYSKSFMVNLDDFLHKLKSFYHRFRAELRCILAKNTWLNLKLCLTETERLKSGSDVAIQYFLRYFIKNQWLRINFCTPLTFNNPLKACFLNERYILQSKRTRHKL